MMGCQDLRALPLVLLVLVAGWVLPAAAQVGRPATVASGSAPASAEARVIVKLKAGAPALRGAALDPRAASAAAERIAGERAERVGAGLGLKLSAGRMLGPRTQVMKATGTDSASLAARLARHPEVAWVQVDRRRHFHHVPADPLFAAGPANGNGPEVGQWYLRANNEAVRSAINAEAAWDLVRGSPSVVVAVIDTGVLPNHPDLAGALLPGYDMIHEALIGNDGNGRDGDASDAGDWVTSNEVNTSSTFRGCSVEDSSWHGTQVASIIGAAAENGVGMAGTAHGVRLLPVRVLGKCGGYDSDIIAAMYWAAGIDQPGVPSNANPARVLNLSLGSTGPCEPGYVEAALAITARNVVIVAAAGNTTGHAVGTPANCPGVIGVAGLRHAGSKVGFSDLGPEIGISAPGGNCINIEPGSRCLYPIVSAINTGLRSALAGGYTWSDSFNASFGTSFSAPMVSGVLALMFSARPELRADQALALLKRSARPFPTSGADNGSDPTPVAACRAPDGTDQLQCYCSTALCGAGMLDALAAVQATLNPDTPEEAARQLMNFGELAFPTLFPDRLPTQTNGPFRYRYNPSTGIYLGVVVQPDPFWTLNGVYVLGGPFGNAPWYVGQLEQYITPQRGLPDATQSR